MKAAKLLVFAAAAFLLAGCTQRTEKEDKIVQSTDRMVLEYAEQFSVDYYGDAALVSIAEEACCWLAPEGTEVPDSPEVPVLHPPLDHLYLASSAAMDPFCKLGALEHVRFTGTTAEDWSLQEVTFAMEAKKLLYAGKYRAPDYELLLSEGCSLAVENTMILHSPAVREQLEALGIPVIVERSSYESHPLGRLEWIKLYGLLVGKAPEAEAYFEQQTASLRDILSAAPTGKSLAFFYVSPNGYINVRRPGDYLTRMVELAGGVYVPDGLSEKSGGEGSVMSLQPEAFYAGARDADVLIYNGNIYEVTSLAQLLKMCELLSDFKAVREGNVWVTEQNLFQETSAIGGMIADFHTVLSGTTENRLTYLRRLT